MKKLGFIVPYRDRRAHLPYFLNAVKGDIVIVEQEAGKPFNRAKLLNVGFLESDFDYFVFHDIDMIPVGVDYSPSECAHLAGRASQFGGRLPYPTYFGGVTMFSRECFEVVDGYSNDFWGWGSEDDEMYNNVVGKGFIPEYRAGRFRSLPHKQADRSYHPENIKRNLAGRLTGLKDCEYKVISKIKTDYTWLKVSI